VKTARKYVKFDAIDPPHEACHLIATGHHEEAITNSKLVLRDTIATFRTLREYLVRVDQWDSDMLYESELPSEETLKEYEDR